MQSLKPTLSESPMAPNCFVTVDYADLLPGRFSDSLSNDFVSFKPVKAEWGSLQIRRFAGPRIQFLIVEGTLCRDLHIRNYCADENTSFNSWFSLSGKVAAQFQDTSARIEVADGRQCYFCKPGVNDDYYLFGQRDPVKLISLSVDKSLLMEMLDDEESWCRGLKEKLFRKEALVNCEGERLITPKMHTILLDILHCSLKGPIRRVLIEAKILELIALQIKPSLRASSKPTEISQSERDCFFQLREFLDANYQHDHTLQSLARAFCLNEFKLKKGFKDLFGTTVFSYIHSLRMTHAHALIADQKLSISVVAGKVGYKNPNHFSAAFKKQFGFSPSSIR